MDEVDQDLLIIYCMKAFKKYIFLNRLQMDNIAKSQEFFDFSRKHISRKFPKSTYSCKFKEGKLKKVILSQRFCGEFRGSRGLLSCLNSLGLRGEI